MSKANPPPNRLQKPRPTSMQRTPSSSSATRVRDEERPLPIGWIMQIDPTTNRPFYVNTNVSPAISTWEHPFESFQYPRSHSPPHSNKLKQRHHSNEDREQLEPWRHRGVERGWPQANGGDYHLYRRSTHLGVVGLSGSNVGTGLSSRPPEQEKKRVMFAQEPMVAKTPAKGIFGRLIDATVGSRDIREAKEELVKAQQELHKYDSKHRRSKKQQQQMDADRAETIRVLYPGKPVADTPKGSVSEDGRHMPLAVAGVQVVGSMPQDAVRRHYAAGHAFRYQRPRSLTG